MGATTDAISDAIRREREIMRTDSECWRHEFGLFGRFVRSLGMGMLVLGGVIGGQSAWAQPVPVLEPPVETPSSSPVQEQEESKTLLAKVGKREITIGDFRQFAIVSGMGDSVRTTDGQIKILRSMIREALLDQALELEDLIKSDKTDRQVRAKALAGLQQRYFPLPPMPSESAVRAYYDANREQFGIPERVRVIQIQLRNDRDNPAGPAARERAEQALKRIEEGEDFTKVAKELTENPNARDTGPDRGFLARNVDPWLREALRGLQPGQYTGIVQSPVGYEILMVKDWRAPLIADFDKVRDVVAARWRAEQQQQALDRYLKILAQQIGVMVTRKGLENAKPANS